MPRPDLALPRPSAAAVRRLDAALALAPSEPAAARALATPLLGQPALHVQALVLLIDLCRRQGNAQAAVLFAERAARLAPKSGRARTLAALALREAGQPERALRHALAAFALTPHDLAAQVALAQAALAVSRPLAGLDAAVALCRCQAQPEARALAAGLFEASTPGRAWGVAWIEEAALTGWLRPVAPGPVTAVLAVDGEMLCRNTTEDPVPGLAPLVGFRLPLPAGLPAGTSLEATLDETGIPLFGSPLLLPEAPDLATTAAKDDDHA